MQKYSSSEISNFIIFGDKNTDLKIFAKKLIKKDFPSPLMIEKSFKHYKQTNNFLGDEKYEKMNINIIEDYDSFESPYTIAKSKMKFLNSLDNLKCFILVLNGIDNEGIIDSLNMEFLKLLDFTWENFWNNLIIVVDNWDLSTEGVQKRKEMKIYENLITEGINSDLKEKFNKSNKQVIFLNSSSFDEIQEEELKIKLVYLKFNWSNMETFYNLNKELSFLKFNSLSNQNYYLDGKIVKFLSFHSGKFLEIENKSPDHHARLVENDLSQDLNQKFLLKRKDDYFSILALHSFCVLDLQAYSKKNGEKVIQWTYNGGDNQLFEFIKTEDDYYNIKGKNSGLFWEISEKSIPESSEVNFIFQSEKNSQNYDHQKFKIIISN